VLGTPPRGASRRAQPQKGRRRRSPCPSCRRHGIWPTCGSWRAPGSSQGLLGLAPAWLSGRRSPRRARAVTA
jgi:hypothetical protein